MLRFQTLIKLIRAHRKIGVFLSLVLLLAIAVSIIRLLMFLILVGITDFFFVCRGKSIYQLGVEYNEREQTRLIHVEKWE